MQEAKLSQNTNQSQYLEYFDKDLKDWEVLQKPSNESQISVYGTPFKDSGVNIIKILFTMKDVTVQTCTKIFGKMQEETFKNDGNVKEFKVLQESETSQTVYQRLSPPIISDREMIVKIEQELTSSNSSTIISQSIDHPDYPENKKTVRAVQFRCMKLNQVGKDVQLEQISFFDMKGSIPKMVMNKMLVSKTSKALEIKYKQAYAIDNKN